MSGSTEGAGPRDQCREMVMLSLLTAFAQSGYAEKKLDVSNLHRALTSVKKNLERDEFRVLRRIRFVIDSDAGRYPLFDDLMERLEKDGVLALAWDEDVEVVTLGRDSAEKLVPRVESLCSIDAGEKKALSEVCSRAMMFYSNLRRTY